MPDLSFLFVQALNGFASASSLFIISAGDIHLTAPNIDLSGNLVALVGVDSNSHIINDVTLSYAAIDGIARRFAGALRGLGVHAGEMYRHPASFYVSISYMCWSSRRMTLALGADGSVKFD